MNTRTLTIIIISVFAMIILAILFVGLHLYGGFEKTSSFFTSLGVFLTLGAIAVAIYIPNKIANQQNKIALFEKKYELYTIYSILVRSANKTYVTLNNKNLENSFDKNFKENKHLRWLMFVNFLLHIEEIDKLIDDKASINETNLKKRARELKQVKHFQNEITLKTFELDKIKYLFSLTQKELMKLDDIINKLDAIYYKTVDILINYKDFKKSLLELAENIKEPTILTTMQKQLQLSSEVK